MKKQTSEILLITINSSFTIVINLFLFLILQCLIFSRENRILKNYEIISTKLLSKYYKEKNRLMRQILFVLFLFYLGGLIQQNYVHILYNEIINLKLDCTERCVRMWIHNMNLHKINFYYLINYHFLLKSETKIIKKHIIALFNFSVIYLSTFKAEKKVKSKTQNANLIVSKDLSVLTFAKENYGETVILYTNQQTIISMRTIISTLTKNFLHGRFFLNVFFI